MKEKFIRFMSGRYGIDQFSKFLLIMVFVLIILSRIIEIREIYWISVALILYTYFRMFSKNYSKRYKENQTYLKFHNRFFGFFRQKINIQKQRKDYHIYNCPSCKQKIRIPRGKGKVSIRCPKCKTEFVKKS